MECWLMLTVNFLLILRSPIAGAVNDIFEKSSKEQKLEMKYRICRKKK